MIVDYQEIIMKPKNLFKNIKNGQSNESSFVSTFAYTPLHIIACTTYANFVGNYDQIKE